MTRSANPLIIIIIMYVCMYNVCVCRHGAHNWEGPGALTALRAVHSLAYLTDLHSWLQRKSSPDFVVFAGEFIGHTRTSERRVLINTYPPGQFC